MSRENVEVIRAGYDAFARGDIDGVLRLLDADVEWAPAIAPILGVESLQGSAAVRSFLSQDLFEGFDEFRSEPLSFEDLGDSVLVETRYVGRGEASGLEIDQVFATLFGFGRGKVVSMRDYETRAEAFAAAARRE